MDWLWIWLAVASVSLILEFCTMEMVSLWTAIGGLIAMILAACGVKLEFQLIVFFATSITLLLSLRKISLKFLQKDNTKTNSDSLIGTTHTLVSDIKENNMGTITISGVTWNAKTIDNSSIKAGKKVEIIEIKGNKLIVKLFK